MENRDKDRACDCLSCNRWRVVVPQRTNKSEHACVCSRKLQSTCKMLHEHAQCWGERENTENSYEHDGNEINGKVGVLFWSSSGARVMKWMQFMCTRWVFRVQLYRIGLGVWTYEYNKMLVCACSCSMFMFNLQRFTTHTHKRRTLPSTTKARNTHVVAWTLNGSRVWLWHRDRERERENFTINTWRRYLEANIIRELEVKAY